MRSWNGWWIIIAILLVADIYVFTTVKFVVNNYNDKLRAIVFSVYWLVSLFVMVFIISFPRSQYLQDHIVFRNYAFAIIIGLFFSKLIASAFFLLDDVRRLA